MCCFLCFLLFCVPGNSSWLSFCAPTSMVIDIVEGQGRGEAQKCKKNIMGKNIQKIRGPRNGQNSIWGNTTKIQREDTQRDTKKSETVGE